MSEKDPFLTEHWEDATPEVLFDACILSQQVVREEWGVVIPFRPRNHLHANAS